MQMAHYKLTIVKVTRRVVFLRETVKVTVVTCLNASDAYAYGAI